MLKSLGVLMSSPQLECAGTARERTTIPTPASPPPASEALAQMEHAGMVLDVSHLNDECFDEVGAHATRPFVASHSNSRGLRRSNNLTDDQFRTIRDMGGIVGLNYCSEFSSNDAARQRPPQTHLDQLAAHIEHLARPGRRGRHRARRRLGRCHGARLPLRCQQDARVPEHAPSTLARP
ncbi:MAG: membrane dipeptidase [Collinsella sp.]